MTAEEQAQAALRVKRREEAIRTARRQFENLPEVRRETLRSEFERTDEEARKVVRMGSRGWAATT